MNINYYICPPKPKAMTSTPVSLNDESLNGSWIDINSASQIHSPMDDDSPEFLNPPYSFTPESVQNLNLISFQVERFLQEAQRNQNATNTTTSNKGQQNLKQNVAGGGSGIFSTDSDVSQFATLNDKIGLQEAASGDLSDSLSLLSRASALEEPSLKQDLQDFDWLWDWTDQPEYFSGQEWKVYAPKQDYLMRQRQLYCANLNKSKSGTKDLFSGEVISLLFLTNILSIIIGAGLTYSILIRRSAV